jgi:NAD+ kinase
MQAKKIGILGHADKEGVKETVQSLLKLLAHRKVEDCFIISELADIITDASSCHSSASPLQIAASSDIIFSLGGDGTLLTAARSIIRSNPLAELIGINLGKLGFIAENAPEILPEIIDELWADTLLREERLLIGAEVSSEFDPRTGIQIRRDDLDPSREGERGDRAHLAALNEIVVDNYGSTRMLTFEITVQGSLLGTIRADGLIIATPTGSTAYAASAGGPIIEPTSPVISITPIASHTLTVRPVIVPQWYEIDLRITCDAATPALIVADGQEEVVADTPAFVRLSGHANKLKLLRRTTHSYFDLLRTKLLWSADARERRGI